MNKFIFGSTLFEVYGDVSADRRTEKFAVETTETTGARYTHTVRVRYADDESAFNPPVRKRGVKLTEFSSDELRCRAETAFDGFSGETSFIADTKNRGKLTFSTLFAHCDIVGILLHRGGILLHSSYIIAPGGKAILFSGPSGIGKSTQAENWKNVFGSSVVNGDRTLIEPANSSANGVFYCGTSGICENVSSEIAAVAVLAQAEENCAAKMTEGAAFRALLSQCALDRYDRDQVEEAISLVSDTVSRVPVFSFACLPDKSAAEYLNEYLKNAGAL